MTPLTPAGQALVNAFPNIAEQLSIDIRRVETEAADRALAELRREVEDALTSEDEIAHGEAVVERPDGNQGGYIGLGSCAYCDGEWPCRTQRGIDRLRASLIDKASKPEEGAL
jgi:hypothetical protein